MSQRAQRGEVPLGEATAAFARIAAQSFGGPAGQIAVIHRIVVDEKAWLDEPQFLHALGYCMLLPGPEAQQLATYVGWLLHGVRGGLIAGTLFVLPGFLAILGLSVLYAGYGNVGLVAATLAGLKPAVFAIIVAAVIRLGRRALGTRTAWTIAAAAFVAIFVFAVPFPAIIVVAALLGYATARGRAATPVDVQVGARAPSPARLVRTVLLWLAVWFVPVLALLVVLGRGHILVEEALFFSRAAVVTFGGAYAVLAYLAQQVVHGFGWLSPGEMLDGLGLAETTPGPLIMVVQFVGYLAASRQWPGVDPVLAGLAGSLVTVWVTFAPCFLFIFAGAPYIEWLRGHRGLSAALGGIMASVVGVVLNLALWFALHTVFRSVRLIDAGPLHLLVPVPGSIDLPVAAIAAGALVAAFRFRAGMFAVLAGGALAGVLIWLLRGVAAA